MENTPANERLLSAWLRLSASVCNERLVTDMPFNEAFICNLLSNSGEDGCTAAALCGQTGILKSQMHRTLESMERRGLICRTRSEVDRRRINIRLTDRDTFCRQHAKSLAIVDRILEKLSVAEALEAIRALTRLADAAREVLCLPKEIEV